MIKQVFLGMQMLMIAFGALVLVPLITGLDARVALFTAGMGTIIFHVLTRGQVPIFLGSSFAFIAPITFGVQTWGIPATLCGLASAGVFYVFLSAVAYWRGGQWLKKIFPPLVTGPVIMLIGLILAPVAVNMAMGKSGDGQSQVMESSKALLLSGVALLTTIAVSLKAKGMLRMMPVLAGILTASLVAALMGMISTEKLTEAVWLSVPAFQLPEWNWAAVIFIFPIAIAPAIEHFGDILAIGSVTGKDYLKNPGVHQTLLGDGLATSAAALIGGPPNTTYSEVTGGVALTGVHDPRIMWIAAGFAIVISFFEKFGALLQMIPLPVMGGILILLFGSIAAIGLNTVVQSGEDLSQPRNLILVSLILVMGLGGMSLDFEGFKMSGVALAGILGIILNWLLPQQRRRA